MNRAAEAYCEKHEKLMQEWSAEVWDWIGCDDTNKPIFYKDGVLSPDVWFDEENTFKPLFILKEVNEERREGENFYCNFVEPRQDPWRGERLWGRIQILAAAMFELKEYGGECDIPEYSDVFQNIRDKRDDICSRIAIINIKKLAGGTTVASEKSKETFCFSCHAARFADKLEQQIKEIAPSIIICCGKNDVAKCLSMKNGTIYGIPAFNGYHPSRSSTTKFYDEALKEMQTRGLFK